MSKKNKWTKQKVNAEERKLLVKVMDEAWQIIIKTTGYCIMTGKRPPEVALVGHHAIFTSAQGFSTRWIIDNGACISTGMHRQVHDAGLNTAENLRKAMIEFMGEDRYKAVQAEREVRPWSNDELKEVWAGLETLLLENDLTSERLHDRYERLKKFQLAHSIEMK